MKELKFILDIFKNLPLQIVEGVFKANHKRSERNPLDLEAKQISREMYQELSKRYVAEVKAMNFRPMNHL